LSYFVIFIPHATLAVKCDFQASGPEGTMIRPAPCPAIFKSGGTCPCPMESAPVTVYIARRDVDDRVFVLESIQCIDQNGDD